MNKKTLFSLAKSQPRSERKGENTNPAILQKIRNFFLQNCQRVVKLRGFLFLVLFGVLLSLACPFSSVSAVIDPGAGPAYAGYGSSYTFSYVYYLQQILNSLWILFTAIAVIFFVVAGILFLTAQGNPEQVSKARSAFFWGVVGVVVGIIAYSIITLVGSIIQPPV